LHPALRIKPDDIIRQAAHNGSLAAIASLASTRYTPLIMTSPRLHPTARSAARLGAVQAMYQLDIGGTDLGETLAQFSSRVSGDNFDNGETGQADFKHLRDVVEGAVREQALLDPAIDKVLGGNWPLHRLDATVRAIIRCGAYELFFRDNVPARVAINEYVDVASAFFEDGDEPGFVNGALNTLARQRRPEEFT
jgi:transcription antitermination protein NusB